MTKMTPAAAHLKANGSFVVYSDSGAWLATVPSKTVDVMLDFHPETWRRIASDIASVGHCKIHLNGRQNPFGSGGKYVMLVPTDYSKPVLPV